MGAAPTFRMLPGLLRVVVLRGEEEEEQDMITATTKGSASRTAAVLATAEQRLASEDSPDIVVVDATLPRSAGAYGPPLDLT